MPLYDYQCAACGRRFEVFHGVHAEGPSACPLCGEGPVRKVITAAAVHYRGSGWAKKERHSAAATRAGSSGAKDDAAGDDASKEPSKAEGSGEGAGSTPSSTTAKGKSGSKAGKTAAATGD
jgi:putative FmdB family regulatory protein